MSKDLVIDACVATSASSKETPVSTMCREFLLEFLKTDYRIVLSVQLHKEWLAHPSRLMTQFLYKLKSRGRILHLEDYENTYNIRENLHNIRDKARIQAIEKDLHLIEAALLTDNTIISRDNKSRKHFCFIMNDFQIIGNIYWVDPTNVQEEPLLWLINGADSESSRSLTNYQPQ